MLIDLCISINDLFLGIVYKETEALKIEGFSILGLPTLFAVDCWYVYMSVCVCVWDSGVPGAGLWQNDQLSEEERLLGCR